jgi:hypothetical protein
MRYCSTLVLTAFLATLADARAQDMSKFPDLMSQWYRTGGIQWDSSKPIGLPQKPPLTPEYQAIFDASVADQARGGQGNDVHFTCIPHGMPRVMTATFPFEIVLKPSVTYILFENQPNRRIWTDGRKFIEDAEPVFNGYSIGRWIDEDGDGKYDVLEAETRNMKGPRTLETSGLPLHKDNETVVRERIYLDKADKDLLHDDVTTIDKAFVGPWTISKTYRRVKNPIWYENNCNEHNVHVIIGKENYFLSADGYLMPARKDQPPPDTRYFNQARK